MTEDVSEEGMFFVEPEQNRGATRLSETCVDAQFRAADLAKDAT